MSINKQFEKLLEPFQIKHVKLRNRIVKPAQATGYSDADCFVTEKEKAFYETVAKGGVGLIIIGGTTVQYPLGCSSKVRSLRMDTDQFISGLGELAESIHKYCNATFLQLGHAGPGISSDTYGVLPISASALNDNEKPIRSLGQLRTASIPEIKDLVGYFASAAGRAKKAGFDGTEIMAAHNYLINSFLSPGWNKREDEYGAQNIENRSRFLVEILHAVRDYVGPDFVVGVRINGSEWGIKNGITIEDSTEIARILEENGADYLDVSALGAGLYNDTRFPEMILYPEPPEPVAEKIKAGLLVPAATAIKKAVSIPVITVGRLDPVLGERILREGRADLIALGRRLLADPELPHKIAAGRLDDIAPCTACLECLSRIRSGQASRCRINAAMGKEREYEIKPAERKKKVMVIGGGPAGMQAARVAALRGHKVSLYEKEPKLGGLLPLAAMVKGIEVEELPAIVRYLKTQITKLGVEINLGKEVKPDLIESIKPDVVILATGSVVVVPDIPGINNPKVVRIAKLHRMLKSYLKFFGPSIMRWLTRFWMPIGKRVVIMGGEIQGCELAEFLFKRGRQVTIVETSDKLGNGISAQHVDRLIPWFASKGIMTITKAKYKEITEKGLTIIHADGKEQTIEADTIIPASFYKPNTEFPKALAGKAPEIHSIGDCSEPRIIVDAIDDGMRIGVSI